MEVVHQYFNILLVRGVYLVFSIQTELKSQNNELLNLHFIEPRTELK